MIKLIVGLGNPGSQYEQTRHNAGFVFLDKLTLLHRVSWGGNKQFHGELGECVLGKDTCALLKPMTFMNRSGMSVGKVVRYFKLKPEEMLVVHDELELPEGVVRLKRDGGHSGHNGLRDIIAHIDSRDFYRLRIGIGRPLEGGGVAEYVLSKPSRQGRDKIESVCLSVLKELNLLINGDIEKFNLEFGRV